MVYWDFFNISIAIFSFQQAPTNAPPKLFCVDQEWSHSFKQLRVRKANNLNKLRYGCTRGLIVAHDDPGVQAADEVAARKQLLTGARRNESRRCELWRLCV